DAVANAQVVSQAAEARFEYAKKRYDLWNELYNAKVKFEAAPNDQELKARAAKEQWDNYSSSEKAHFEEAETLCLRDDINDLRRRVEEHIAMLGPKNVADQVKKVRAADTTSKSDGAAFNESAVKPDDLTDIRVSDIR